MRFSIIIILTANLEFLLTSCLLNKIDHREPFAPTLANNRVDITDSDLDLNDEAVASVLDRKFSALSMMAEYLCSSRSM